MPMAIEHQIETNPEVREWLRKMALQHLEVEIQKLAPPEIRAPTRVNFGNPSDDGPEARARQLEWGAKVSKLFGR